MILSSDLQVRRTHRYVGTFKHLDEHETIGSYRHLSTHVTEEDDEDGSAPMRHEHYVIVESTHSDADIERALQDGFTAWGCAHEHDCCGCRSYRASAAKRVTGDLWCVEVSSSRNV